MILFSIAKKAGNSPKMPTPHKMLNGFSWTIFTKFCTHVWSYV